MCMIALGACATGEGAQLSAPRQTRPAPGKTAASRSATQEAKSAQNIRVALLLPLSGSYRDVGQAMLNAATMALFDLGDPRIEIRPHDTKGTPEGASAATEAAFAEGDQIIVGPLLASSIRAAAPIAHKHDIKIIGFSSDRTVAGNGVYLLSFLPDEEIRRVLSYAHANGYQSYAAFVPQTRYGDTVLKSFTATLTEMGANIATSQTYLPDSAKIYGPAKLLAGYDFRHQELLRERAFLTRLGKDDFAQDILNSLAKREVIGKVKFKAAFLPEGGSLLREIAPLFPYYDMDGIKLLGTGLWYDPTLLQEPQLTGGWFAAPDPAHTSDFFDRYTKLYKKSSPRISTLAYDAIALVATLLADHKKTDFSDHALTTRSGFSGIDGIFRFRPDGTAERGLAVLEIHPEGFKVISPAPQNFSGFEELMSGKPAK
jgi:branched-chain amino acid transport system substrate-binding protein